MKKLVFSICISVLAVLLVTGWAAAAAPSFFGYTGLVAIPTADALDKGEYSAAGFAIDLENGVDSNVYTGNVGLAKLTEIGFARIKPDGAPGETFVNAKHEFQLETDAHPAIAAGVIDITGETESTAYVVISKSVRRGSGDQYGDIAAPRLHVGVGGGQLNGFFGGLSASLGARLLLMAEYDSSNINFGARLAITKELRLHGAMLDGDDLALGASFTKAF
jgi:hypothetical protein